jgi:hypothetical protein
MLTAVFLHGFGARYDLPITLALYLYGGAAVVVISFVLVVLFSGARTTPEAVSYPRRRAPWLAVIARSQAVRVIGGALGVLGLLAVVVTGLSGAPDALRNPSAYLVWIYLWVGLVLVTGLVGNVWRLLNPFAALYDLGAALCRTPRPRTQLPARLGIWPAAILFLGIAWLELGSGQASVPHVIAGAAIGYTVLTLAGMAVFGRDSWLQHCEALTVLFGIVSRFAPLEVNRDERGNVVEAWVRPWGTGLLAPVTPGWDRIVFVILMLSNLAFDGIEATPPWFAIASTQPAVAVALGPSWRVVVYSAGLAGLALVFLAVFVVFMRLVIYFGVTEVDRLAAMTSFALTLVPIALAYDLAHNYTYLVVQGQALIPLLADPLAKGWNLLPTRGYQPSWALAGPATVWLMQVVLIVIGHVLAVYLAHLRSLQWFRTARNAVLSQYPMLVLMVAYTMTSLWILSQPITNAG